MRFAALIIFLQLLSAQESLTNQLNGNIAGTVVIVRTETPVAEADVYLDMRSKTEMKTTTDSGGHYEFRDVPAGPHRLTAMKSPDGTPFRAAIQVTQITLNPAESRSSVNFQLPLRGTISGRVFDEDKEPIPGVSVMLVAREYAGGALRYVYASAAQTNDRGEYTLGGVEPDRAYIVEARRLQQRLPAISGSPADPRLRRRAMATSFYPGSPAADGASPITLKPDERREGIDFQIHREPSFCIDGILEANGRPAPLTFDISEASPTSGQSGNGGFYTSSPSGTAAEDGKFRACGLTPGDYTLTAMQFAGTFGVEFYGNTPVSIADKDVHGLKIPGLPLFNLAGEVAFDGPPPASQSGQPIKFTFALRLQPMMRSFMGENTNVNTTVPGTFSMEKLPASLYSVLSTTLPTGTYIKNITYNGNNILYQPVPVGSGTGEPSLRILLGTDSGYISASVTDGKGSPATAFLNVIPAVANSEARLAAAMISGGTDQKGAWESPALAPGKYYVIATSEAVDKSPESIGRLWERRTSAEEIDLGPTATVAVTLTPVAQ